MIEKSDLTVEFLNKYLLGRLSPEEQDRLERWYFENEGILGQLLIAYDEMLDKFLSGRLTPTDRKLFEEKFLYSPACRKRQELDRFFRNREAAIFRPAAKPQQPLRNTATARFSLIMSRRFSTSTSRYKLKLAAAAIGVVAVLVAVLVFPRFHRPTRFDAAALGDINFVYETHEGQAQREGKLELMGVEGVRGKSPVILSQQDGYGIEIKPQVKVYLYVVQWDTNGNMSVLFPNMEFATFGNPLLPGQSYRIPSTDSWLQLDSIPGEETIALGASSVRWDEMKHTLRMLMQGRPGERAAAQVAVRKLVVEAETHPEGRYFGTRFSFRHGLIGE